MLNGRLCRQSPESANSWVILLFVWMMLTLMLPSVVQCNTLLVNKKQHHYLKPTKIINVMDWGAKGDGKTGKLQ